MSRTGKFVLAITGASGAPYAVRLLDVLLAAGREVHLLISPSGQAVLRQELGIEVDLNRFAPRSLLRRPPLPWAAPGARPTGLAQADDQMAEWAARLHYHHHQDFMAPVASGSFLADGMVICPCSGATLSAVAHGNSTNLIQRAAEVHLKERWRLVLVPRETPLSLVQIDNMRRATEAGAVLLPAMPGFYHGARGVDDLIDFVVARICDQLGIEHQVSRRWGDSPEDVA